VRIRDHLRVANPSLVAQLVAPSKGSVENRFWQQGGGFDRNVPDEDALGNMINYIHMNPVRRGLCESMFDWPFSSARGYYPELSDPPPIPIDLVG